MTDVNVTASKGILFKKSNGASPEVFTVIGGIRDLPSFFSEKSVKDRTDMSDSNLDYGLGIGQPPRVTLTIFWDPTVANQTALVTEHDNETKSNYQVVCPNSPASTYTIKALVPKYGTPRAGVDGDLEWDVDFQLVENDDGKIVTKS